MKISRAFTDGPLVRQYEARTAARNDRTIPWSSFAASRYSRATLGYVARAARVLAAGEYGALTLFSTIASGLALHGAPFDLVAAAVRIPDDEMRHADAFTRFAALCAGTSVESVVVDVETEGLHKRCVPAATLLELDHVMIQLSAVNETIAGAFLDGCLESATDPVAHALHASILRDEVHHARLGWYYLAWRAPRWTLEERRRVADQTGLLVMDIARRHKDEREPPHAVEVEARALGVIDFEERRKIVCSVMEEEVLPALDSFGLGASLAYKAGIGG
jgi:hypothetical protein